MSLFQYINRTLNSSRSLILFAIFAGYFFVRMSLMPLGYDDYSYSFIWDAEHGGNLDGMQIGSPEIEHRDRVESFADIVQSQWNHYFSWGGRVFAHSLAQFFLWIGKPCFNIVNTIVFILFILVIINLANTWLKISRKALVWIFLSLNLFAACSLNTMLWLTGSCNYMWMSFVQLFFLTPYVKALRSHEAGNSALNVIIMSILGILAGWSNEAGALVTIFLTFLMSIMCKTRGIFRPWMLVGLISLMIGCAFMLFAPGNFARLALEYPNYHYTAEIFFRNLQEFFSRIVITDLIVLIPMFIYFFKRKPGKLNTSEILMLLFALGGLIVPTIMLFVPDFNLRIAMPSIAFTLVAATSAILEINRPNFNFSLNLPKQFLHSVSIALTTVLIAYFITIIYVDISVFNASRRQVRYIQRNSELDPVELPPLPVRHRFEKIHTDRTAVMYLDHLGGILDNPNYCLNLMVAQYYGVRHVVAIKD